MTKDTVAGDSPRCAARNFKLTDCAAPFPRRREDGLFFAPVIEVFSARSLAQERRPGKRHPLYKFGQTCESVH